MSGELTPISSSESPHSRFARGRSHVGESEREERDAVSPPVSMDAGRTSSLLLANLIELLAAVAAAVAQAASRTPRRPVRRESPVKPGALSGVGSCPHIVIVNRA